MVLSGVGTRAGEPLFQHAQLPHPVDVELLPAMRLAALTLTADLKTEQALRAVADAVVVRLDDAESAGFVDEFDETLVDDRANEIVIHGIAAL